MKIPFHITNTEEYNRCYTESVQNPDNFWNEIASNFLWRNKWSTVLDYNFESARFNWFVNGKLNITENCIDRHLLTNSEDIAIIWEPNFENEASHFITYRELHQRVIKFALVLKNNGIQKGDRVCINMGMIPELAIAILACARIGAIHSVIFGGFSSKSIADRLVDADAKMIICCDGAFRGKKIIPIKSIIDDALKLYSKNISVIVYQRTKTKINFNPSIDKWWHEEMNKINELTDPLVILDSDDPLFILYTSGSTGKPKGVVHSCGGYMVYTAYSFVNAFQYHKGMVHFCTADIGWITGHSYIVYGPLLCGATSIIYEGIPTWPKSDRFWKIIDKHKVNIFYTAPTAIRSLMSYGLAQFENSKLNSLKVIGSVGEPINEEAWHWYYDNVGKKNCPLIDTWWQTETGGILISDLAGITKSPPSIAGKPLPGIQPVLVNEDGNEIVDYGTQGKLCIKFPWPSIIFTTYRNHDRCIETYFKPFTGKYYTGDGAYLTKYGNYRIIGRVDDVLNISGHRIGTAEVENAINSHPEVLESAIVGYPHPVKGEAICAFVIIEHQSNYTQMLRNEIENCVSMQIGSFAKPDRILQVPGLPKTRSGKIMRRILRKIASGDTNNLGDLTSLLDSSIVDKIIELNNSDQINNFEKF
ncbi:MAG: acetate--CoA ligase [Saprospiraceae bacterium]|nr:acetate--CoA ligase [Saprospiraceae bacterium]